MFTFNPSTTERDGPAIEVDVTPTQPQQLGASSASHGGEYNEHVQLLIATGESGKQLAKFDW